MSTPVTAEELVTGAHVWHDQNLCVITEKHSTGAGAVFVGWTENLCGQETFFSGSFSPDAYFGEKTFL